MSTTSKPRRPIAPFAGLAAAGALILAACIQGPWDYYPHNPQPFRGVYLSGYVLAGKPVRHVCFERVLDLAEEATEAYPFYDSADVRLAGRFSGADTTLHLIAVSDTPNCFQGDSALLAERGGDYALTGRFVRDSAGTQVASVLTATAHMPDSFSVHRTASAPSFAKTGGIPNDIFNLGFIATLPPNVQSVLLKEYGDTLTRIQNDSAALKAYLAVNGPKIQARLVELLSDDHFAYHEGDTLFYLNGALNTLSHYFSSDRSADVKSVLITQRFEPNSARPETRFDSPFGFKPDSSRYYFPGYIRRLILYQDAKGNKGWNLLDSMGVVNVWFHTLRNRLYFYGFEQAYLDYITTNVENAGADVRVKPKFNVTGGNGFFVGGIPDSFDVYIKVDTLTKSYPLEITHGLFCDHDGWQDSKDCREYYPGYCSDKGWNPSACGPAAIAACLEADAKPDTALKARCAAKADSARKDTAVAARGADRFCIERDFPADNPACADATAKCLGTKGANACKQALWDYCLDRAWRPDQCQPALASYCHDKPRLSETLCRHADEYCAAHPGSVLCH